jgi:hypothetical protein
VLSPLILCEVAPVDHKNEYGPTPPLTVTAIAPVVPLQPAGVTDGEMEIANGSETWKLCDTVHCPDVTITEYVPATKPFTFCVVAPLDQAYV